jgi:hypothetical protein
MTSTTSTTTLSRTYYESADFVYVEHDTVIIFVTVGVGL